VRDQTSVSQEHTNVDILIERSSKLLTVAITLLTLLFGAAFVNIFVSASVDSRARHLYAAAVVMAVVAALAGLGAVNWGSMYTRIQTLYRIQIATLVGLFVCLAGVIVIVSFSPAGAVEKAVKEYYYAVDREDWDYTFDNLDSESQDLLSRDQWRQKNEANAEAEKLELSRMEVDVSRSGLGSNEVDVRVERWFKHGEYIDRNTVFVHEDGSWKHHITESEKEQVFNL
jgi:hypothetical protein